MCMHYLKNVFVKKSTYFLTLLFKVKMNARNFYQFRLKTFYFNFEPKKECPVHLAMNIMGTRNMFFGSLKNQQYA